MAARSLHHAEEEEEECCCLPGRGSQAPWLETEEPLRKEPFSQHRASAWPQEAGSVLSGTPLIVAFLQLCSDGQRLPGPEHHENFLSCSFKPPQLAFTGEGGVCVCGVCLVSAAGSKPTFGQGTRRRLSRSAQGLVLLEGISPPSQPRGSEPWAACFPQGKGCFSLPN